MAMVRTLLVVAVGLGLVAAAPSAQAAKAKKAHALHGVVKDISKDADKDSGTITVTIPEHKNKKTGETKPAEDKTFKVTDATKFFKVSGKKPDVKEEPATFAQLKDGERVNLTVLGDEVQDVKFRAKKKNK